jgi:hypothetical protein
MVPGQGPKKIKPKGWQQISHDMVIDIAYIHYAVQLYTRDLIILLVCLCKIH